MRVQTTQSRLNRRAASCKRRKAALVTDGDCWRCAYRMRGEDDVLCERCRGEHDVERTQKREDAAAINEFAAQPERVHEASSLNCGVSPARSSTRNLAPC